MTRMIKATAAAALTVLSGLAFAAPSVDANIEMDTDYASKAKADGSSEKGFRQAGRVELNVAGKTEKGGFVAGRVSFLGQKGGGVATDDVWVQFGNASADLKLGRFEAADLFMVGKDTIIEDAGVSGYRNVLRGRFASDVAHAAATFNASSALSVELGVIGDNQSVAVRPVVTYSANGMVVRAGVDAGKIGPGSGGASAKRAISGLGVTVGVPVAGGTVNASVNSGKVENALGVKVKGTSVGLNGTFGNFGLGYISDKNDNTKTEHNVYTALVFQLLDTGATITPAVAYSKVSGSPTQVTGRVRVNYTF
ncbi:carbohydrate porin [Pseudaquabacterium rugosum]|uniref:Carbohydrate porin n=1 Tax=Pseudaquabacterium rugosum TaxID=2984194 RepID=A0ABU9BD28_9BURK